MKTANKKNQPKLTVVKVNSDPATSPNLTGIAAPKMTSTKITTAEIVNTGFFQMFLFSKIPSFIKHFTIITKGLLACTLYRVILNYPIPIFFIDVYTFEHVCLRGIKSTFKNRDIHLKNRSCKYKKLPLRMAAFIMYT